MKDYIQRRLTNGGRFIKKMIGEYGERLLKRKLIKISEKRMHGDRLNIG